MSLSIEPGVVSGGGSINITCSIANSDSDVLRIAPPGVIGECTAGCMESSISGCNYSPQECKCDALQKPNDFCIGAQQVSYLVNNVDITLSGEWICDSANTGASETFSLTVYSGYISSITFLL